MLSHNRISIVNSLCPIATIIFALLAIPLGCRGERGSRARSFLFSALIVGGYYYIGRAAELQARHGDFPVLLAAWLPNLIGSGCARYSLLSIQARAV